MSRPLFQLDPRLSAIAERVTRGRRVLDVGTDHALLPIWLCKTGVVPRAIASDINPAPLKQAQRNSELYQCGECLELRLSDGLKNIAPGEVDEIIIAGMGGEVIAEILLGVPWSRDPRFRWILQPMSSAEKLRDALSESGFALESEAAVRSGDWIYTLLTAVYTGKSETLSSTSALRWIGRLDPMASPENRQYIRRQQRHIRNLAAGCRARGETEAGEEYRALERRLGDLIKNSEE